MHYFSKLYYRLTADHLRPLPRTKEDIEEIKRIFIHAYNVKNEPQVWYTIFSNMAAVRNTCNNVSYKDLLTITERLDINRLLQDHKILEHQVHMDNLKAQNESTDLPNGAPHFQGELQVLPPDPVPVVPENTN